MGRLFSEQVISFSKYSAPYNVEWETGPASKTWKSKSIDAVANVVCEVCNNGWMSDLDFEASATMSNMIRYGSAVSLLPLGVASIARFAYKAAVIVDCGKSTGIPFFSPAERKRFSEGDHDIPKGVQVWLSTVRTTRLHGRYTGHYGKIKTGRFRHFKGFVFTYTVGFLVIQLAAVRWGSRVLKQPRLEPHFRQANIWNTVSTPLWPPDGRPILWPTEQFLTDETINAIAERWAHLSEGIA
jgi:hypothetical protein